ncbi:MAG: DUF2232 domain-containing protein [Gemmatimonadota bacterium]
MPEGGERGWGPVAGLGLVTIGLSVVQPLLVVTVPLALLLFALPPRRPALVALAAVLLAVPFLDPAGGALWYAERGWVLVLGAWYVAVSAFRPGAAFLPRALTAVGCSVATTALAFAVGGGEAWPRIDWLVTQRYHGAAANFASLGAAAEAAGVRWSPFASAIHRAAELQSEIYPALLAVGSLAGLGVAWWLYRWLSARDTAALRPLREFRFGDGLVWLFIAGVLLVALPDGGGLPRAGTNLLAFMGLLYALRGLAVLLALVGGIGLGGAVVAAVAALLLYPLVMLGTFLVGLSDTWLDLRARADATADAGS